MILAQRYPRPGYFVWIFFCPARLNYIPSTMSTSDSDEDLVNDAPLEERIDGYKRIVLIPEIEQMMFVAGETGEPTSETTTLIEQIVHEQVLELASAHWSRSQTER